MEIWVAWKEIEPYRRQWTTPIIHIQNDKGGTICGIKLGFDWAFDCHPNADSVNCKRCLKSFNIELEE